MINISMNQKEHHSMPVSIEAVAHKIFFIRGEKVMLDSDLAALYGVETKMLNRAVKRNQERFPDDFMFQLTMEEAQELKAYFSTSERGTGSRFQFGTSNIRENKRGGRQTLPFVFTEQGVAMPSGVLRSKRAVQVNVEIMRAFVKLRQLLSENKELTRRLNDLEKKYDAQFKIVFDAIRELMKPPEKPKPPMGFHANLKKNT